MDARFRFKIKECQVNIKKDVQLYMVEPLYSISSDMTVVVNQLKHDKLQQGDAIDAVIRIEKNEKGDIEPKCVELELASIRERKIAVTNNNHRNAIHMINRMKEDLVLRDANDERVSRINKNQ